jgi:hypothetical protein
LFLEFAGQLEQPARYIGVRRRVREPTTALRLLAKKSRLPAYVIAVSGHVGVNTGPAPGIPS